MSKLVKLTMLAASTAVLATAAFAATGASTEGYFTQQVQTGTTARVAIDKLKTSYGPENISVDNYPFMAVTPKSLKGKFTLLAVKVLDDKKHVKGSVEVMLCPDPDKRNKTGLDFEQFRTAWTQQTLFIGKKEYDTALSTHCASAEKKPAKDIAPKTWTKIAGLESEKQAACYYKDKTTDNKLRTVSFAEDVVNKVTVYVRAVTIQQQTVCAPNAVVKTK